MPDVGVVVISDAETGEQLEVDTSDRGFRERFAVAAAEREARDEAALRHAGVESVTLSTEDDLVRAIVRMATSAGGGAPTHELPLAAVAPRRPAGPGGRLARDADRPAAARAGGGPLRGGAAGGARRPHAARADPRPAPGGPRAGRVHRARARARPAPGDDPAAAPRGHADAHVDVSGSMAADDATPTRMEAAKAAAMALVERRPEGVVIGVVAFSDAGVAVQPPTSDMTPSRQRSRAWSPLAAPRSVPASSRPSPRSEGAGPDPGGLLQQPLPGPVGDPRPGPAPGSDAATLVVVLSDGENNERPDPLEAAAAADQGIRIVAMGMGTAQGATLDLDGFKVETRARRDDAQGPRGRHRGLLCGRGRRDPAPAIYEELARALVVREEPLELTALIAAVGLGLLLAASAAVAPPRRGGCRDRRRAPRLRACAEAADDVPVGRPARSSCSRSRCSSPCTGGRGGDAARRRPATRASR